MEKREEITVEAGNRLIAGFMGAKFNKEHPTILYPAEHFEVRNVEDLQYHSSWSWLMPVVEKINSLPMIKGVVIQQANMKEIVIEALIRVDKYRIWYAVVQFINWYSEYQKQEHGK